MMPNNGSMWNSMGGGQAPFHSHDPNAWGQQAAIWTQQQQQQQQMWNQSMWNPQMPSHMGPPMDPNMMHQNMGPPMGPMPVNQYGMMDPQQSWMNMVQPNWNCGPPQSAPPVQQYPMQPGPPTQSNQNSSNWGGYTAPAAAKAAPVPDTRPNDSAEKEKEKKEKEKPVYKRTNITLPDIPEELQPQVEALQIYGVVPANRKKSQYVSNTGMGFYCEVCECYISSLTNAETHVRGVRHKQNKKFREGGEGVFVVATKKRYVHMDSAEDTDITGKALLGKPMPNKRKRNKTSEPDLDEAEEQSSEVASDEENVQKAPSADGIHYEVLTEDAKIQSTLDALEEPIIGLNEIVEHQIQDNSLPAYYICKPCDVRLNANNLMFHIKGLRHRLTYMQTLKPDEVKDIEQKKHHEQVTLINKLTAEMESQLGRGKVQAVVDNDTSRHPYSIRMAIKEREGHIMKKPKVEENEPTADSENKSVTASTPTKPAAVGSPSTAKATAPLSAGTVVGTKIVIKPDGTRVRVKTVLRPKNASTKPEASSDGSQSKTVVKQKLPMSTSDGTAILVTKTTSATGKVLVKKIIKRTPTTPEVPFMPGLNDQPLVFGASSSVQLPSRIETASQTEELHSAFILEKLKHFRVDTEETTKQVLFIIDALSEAMMAYKLRNLPPTLQDAVLERVSTISNKDVNAQGDKEVVQTAEEDKEGTKCTELMEKKLPYDQTQGAESKEQESTSEGTEDLDETEGEEVTKLFQEIENGEASQCLEITEQGEKELEEHGTSLDHKVTEECETSKESKNVMESEFRISNIKEENRDDTEKENNVEKMKGLENIQSDTNCVKTEGVCDQIKSKSVEESMSEPSGREELENVEGSLSEGKEMEKEGNPS